MEEVRGRDGVEGVVAKGKTARVADDFVNRAVAPIEEMVDLEVDAGAKPARFLEQIGSAGADVEDRARIAAATEETAIDRDAAPVAIEAAQIAKGALHVGAGRGVVVGEARLRRAGRRGTGTRSWHG